MNKGNKFYTPAETTKMPRDQRQVESKIRMLLVVDACLDGNAIVATSKFFGYKSSTTMATSLLNCIGFSFYQQKYIPRPPKVELGDENASSWNAILTNKRLGVPDEVAD